jgi:hypothetical protein
LRSPLKCAARREILPERFWDSPDGDIIRRGWGHVSRIPIFSHGFPDGTLRFSPQIFEQNTSECRVLSRPDFERAGQKSPRNQMISLPFGRPQNPSNILDADDKIGRNVGSLGLVCLRCHGSSP